MMTRNVTQKLQTAAVDSYRRSQSCRKSKQVHRMWLLRSELPDRAALSLSSRQRIVLQREISRLKQSGTDPERLSLLEKQYRYPGNQTCAGDGLCSMSCPMNINTGDLTHIIRQETLPKGSLGYKAGDFVANHFAGVKSSLRPVLSLANFGHSVLGTKAMSSITKGMHNVLGIPLWNACHAEEL